MVFQASHNAPDFLRVGEATIHETIGRKEKAGQGLKCPIREHLNVPKHINPKDFGGK
jgi:hypothetical protein